MKTTQTIKFQWKTKYTHPQNSTQWNIETTSGLAEPDSTPDFDDAAARDLIGDRHPNMCGASDDLDPQDVVEIGRIWAIDADGEGCDL